jgi:4-hydroxybenzoate polyprenyltransferase
VHRSPFGLAFAGSKLKPRSIKNLRLPSAATPGFFAFARPGNWFVSKIPPLLAVAYLAILRLGVDRQEAVRLLACGLLSIICVAIYGHVINDIFDQEADRLAKKVNRLSGMRPVCRVLLAGAFLIAGFLPALIAYYPIGVLSLLTVNYLWPTIYSIPITRLKEKGLFGVACDALGSHITPTLFVLALFATSTPARSRTGQTGIAMVATVWAAVLGLKGILHHQIADQENDLQSGIVTFATKSGLEFLQRFLTRFNLLIELPVSAVFTAMVASWCPLAVVALVLYAGSEAIKYKLGFKFALTANPATVRSNVPFTNEMFYVLWLPIAAATQLGFDNPAFIWLPIVHLVVFQQPVAQQVADWRAIIKYATPVYRARHGRQAN